MTRSAWIVLPEIDDEIQFLSPPYDWDSDSSMDYELCRLKDRLDEIDSELLKRIEEIVLDPDTEKEAEEQIRELFEEKPFTMEDWLIWHTPLI